MKKNFKIALSTIGILFLAFLIKEYYLNWNRHKKVEIPSNRYSKPRETIMSNYEMLDNWGNDCSINTSSMSIDYGIDIQAFYPCALKPENPLANRRKDIICQYIQVYKDNIYSFSISSTKLDEPVSENQIKSITSEKLKKLIPKESKFVESSFIKVDNIPSIEMLTIKKVSESHIAYILDAMIYLKEKAVTISFGIASDNENNAHNLFFENKERFRALIQKTKISY